jgi:FdhD protein
MINQKISNPITFSKGSWKKSNHIPPEETSVVLTVNGEAWLSFGCSPFMLEELAVGFLFNEHVINSFSEIEDVRLCENNRNIDVWLNHIAEKPERWENTSGCAGGKTSRVERKEEVITSDCCIDPQLILDLFSMLLTKQENYKETRGIHCSLMSDGLNNHLIAEDIGRHNTIDKLAGLFLRTNDQEWSQKFLLTTGRVSSEMVQKSARLGAAIVVTRTSPTKSSVDFAEEHNITLIGYTRRNEFTIYSNPQRFNT